MAVDLFKEHKKAKAFYVPISNKDIAEGLTMEDVVVLEIPKQEYNNSLKSMGCQFTINIIDNIKYYMSKI